MSLWKKLAAGTAIGGFIAYKAIESLLIPVENTPIPPASTRPAQTQTSHYIPNSTLDNIITTESATNQPTSESGIETSTESTTTSSAESDLTHKEIPMDPLAEKLIDTYYNGSTLDFANFLSKNRSQLMDFYDTTFKTNAELDKLIDRKNEALSKLNDYRSIRDFIQAQGNNLSLNVLYALLNIESEADLVRNGLIFSSLFGDNSRTRDFIQTGKTDKSWSEEKDYQRDSRRRDAFEKAFGYKDSMPDNLYSDFIDLLSRDLIGDLSISSELALFDYEDDNDKPKLETKINRFASEKVINGAVLKLKSYRNYNSNVGYGFISRIPEDSLYMIGVKRDSVGFFMDFHNENIKESNPSLFESSKALKETLDKRYEEMTK